MKVSNLMLILGLLICATSVAKERIYRWTDESGEVHYAAIPPPGVGAELVQLPKNKLPEPVAATAAPAKSPSTAPGQTNSDTEPEGPTRAELVQQAKDLCERGHLLVDTLEPRPQAILTQPDGSVRSLSNSERQQRIDRGYMLINKYCNYRP